MSFYVRARFDVHDHHGFEEVARALRDQAASEPGTLTYRWFSGEPGSYVVIEEYTDVDAAFAHNDRGAALLERGGECADMVEAEIYGDINDELWDWVAANPVFTAYPEVFAQPD
ncbi:MULTISPECIES: putative quinol monooxygenase [Amycolatopsis]|uniref:putative quinol monooxygenase n=1 Tax=Amycolatopsis TaxID=1813 RepID=UPI003D7650A0